MTEPEAELDRSARSDRRGEPARHDAQEPPAEAIETPGTGVPAADDATRRLADIDDAAVEEHVGIYEDVHRRLQEGLADLDEP